MSELKVIKIELDNHGKPIASIQGTTSYCGISRCDEFYTKDEADKEIAEMQKQVHDYAQGLYVIQARAEKELRHQKYKRCLAMAKWCDTKADWYYGIGRSFRDRVEFYIKWHNRWLELAEKFKEAN